jgi:UDP-2,4-diacetamido-2,4,6-trideoxy-beta-L-altropyranose hydrolase
MRCLALAQAWQEAGGDAVFAVAEGVPALEGRIVSEDFGIERIGTDPGGAEDIAKTGALARDSGAGWVVVDGYRFGAGFQRALRDAGLKVLFIDDNGHAESYCADIVLNQNVHAAESMYARREPGTRLLLGTRYALLRKEFWSWRGWKRETPDVARKVLVTLGGSDPDNVTTKVVRALGPVDIEGLEAVVVVGGGNPHLDEITSAAAASRARVRVERIVTNMPELMAWADVAVSAAGSTVWELAFMGLPTVLLVLAENQARSAGALGKDEVAVDLGRAQEATEDGIARAVADLLSRRHVRERLCTNGKDLVDGLGAERVVESTRERRLGLRPAREEDRSLLWEWANDPQVRRASFSSEPIRWEEHVGWFRSKMDDANCTMLIVTDAEQRPVGQVRLEVNHEQAVVSVSIDREHRGKGLGSEAIHVACREVLAARGIEKAHAYVKRDNTASIRSFQRAGFASAGPVVVDGCDAVHLILGIEGGERR